MRAHGLLITAALCCFGAAPAGASFHFMQIEQVIGGVDGSPTVQAVQLRMRSSFQGQVQNARLVVRDAAGLNPVLLIDFSAPVPSSAAGSRVLAATANFSTFTNPPLTPDFTLANTIPASYLAAGSLTFESDPPTATVYWRLSWGGAGYTGTGSGSSLNDDDGNYNPPFAGPLPSATGRALLFQLGASAASTNNASDYALTAGAATFTNNAGQSAAIKSVTAVGDGLPSGVELGPPAPNPARGTLGWTVALPRESRVRVRLIDTAGRVARLLADERLPAGVHRLSRDLGPGGSRELPSGVYFLELEALGERLVRRVARVR